MKFLIIFCSLLVAQSSAQNLANVKAIFYGSSLSDSVSITLSNLGDFTTLPVDKFDPSKRTEIIIHGWTESVSSFGPQAILNAYLAQKSALNVNLVFIDWGAYSLSSYMIVAAKLNIVGDTVRQLLDSFRENGLNIANTHLVGFSFGTVIAGRAARWFPSNRSVTFSRISGLDPGAFFSYASFIFFINGITNLVRSDATFVDIIHTNADGFSDPSPRGHLDFWPNGGKTQPGCGTLTLAQITTLVTSLNFTPLVACSHFRAWQYYAESIGNSNAFLSKKCASATYTDANCQGPTTSVMGYYASSAVAGFSQTATLSFYLTTNSASPFSKS